MSAQEAVSDLLPSENKPAANENKTMPDEMHASATEGKVLAPAGNARAGEDGAAPSSNRTAVEGGNGKEAHAIVGRAVADAESLLAHAAEIGLDVKPELIVTIEQARHAFAHDEWTTDLAKAFWPAYSQLCALVKPVSAESLAASSGDALNKTLRRYRFGAIWLAAVILPVSVVMFINTSISNEIVDRIKENDQLAVSLREHLLTVTRLSVAPAAAAQQSQTTGAQSGAVGAPLLSRLQTERDVVTALQQFATANRLLYARANLLNAFVLKAEPDPFAGDSLYEQRMAFELPAKLEDKEIPEAGFSKIATYQEIRGYAKNVQQMNLVIYGAITAFVLPILYALLGACAYGLRALSEQTTARTYRPSYAALARIVIAMIAGLVVGLFNNFTQGVSLSPLAVAFLVGYAVEVFFSFLDAFLDTLKKVRS